MAKESKLVLQSSAEGGWEGRGELGAELADQGTGGNTWRSGGGELPLRRTGLPRAPCDPLPPVAKDIHRCVMAAQRQRTERCSIQTTEACSSTWRRGERGGGFHRPYARAFHTQGRVSLNAKRGGMDEFLYGGHTGSGVTRKLPSTEHRSTATSEIFCCRRDVCERASVGMWPAQSRHPRSTPLPPVPLRHHWGVSSPRHGRSRSCPTHRPQLHSTLTGATPLQKLIQSPKEKPVLNRAPAVLASILIPTTPGLSSWC